MIRFLDKSLLNYLTCLFENIVSIFVGLFLAILSPSSSMFCVIDVHLRLHTCFCATLVVFCTANIPNLTLTLTETTAKACGSSCFGFCCCKSPCCCFCVSHFLLTRSGDQIFHNCVAIVLKFICIFCKLQGLDNRA